MEPRRGGGALRLRLRQGGASETAAGRRECEAQGRGQTAASVAAALRGRVWFHGLLPRRESVRGYECPTQVPPLWSLFVPSGQMVLDQTTSMTLAPLRLAPARLALVRLASFRLAPLRLRSFRLALVRLASFRLAPLRLRSFR